MGDDVMIAVDPHKASNTAAVLDPVTRTLIETARFANTDEGYGRLTGFARRREHRRWAVEGCHGAGRSLSQRLAADGEMVLDVPAKLAARVRVYSRGHGRKTDKHDAVSIGLAALEGASVLPVARDDMTVSLRLLCDRREELTAQRTQAVCRLHRLLAELTPGGMRRELTANKAQALLARIRPADDVAAVRVHIARDHLAGVRALDARLKYLTGQIAALVTESGTTLMTLYGIGPLIAGRILAEAGDVARFATRDKFASYNGTAPVDASSGDQVRHRLSRAGNRRINHALHMMAVTQIRYPGTDGRRYYERKRKEGKTPKEALRCLKRRLSDAVCRQLVHDRHGRIETCGSPRTPRPTRSTSTSPASRSPRDAPPSRPAPRPPRTDSSPGLEGRPARRPGDPRRKPPPAPRPPRGSRNHRLTAPQSLNASFLPRPSQHRLPPAPFAAAAQDARAPPASRPGRRPARRAALTPASTGTGEAGERSRQQVRWDGLTERSRSVRD
jgi:transposase